MDQNWDPSAGYLVLDSVSSGPFFLTFADLAGRRERTLAPGGPEERNRRFAQFTEGGVKFYCLTLRKAPVPEFSAL